MRCFHFADKNIVARKGQLLVLPGVLPYSAKRLSDKVAFYTIDFSYTNPYDFVIFGAPYVLSLINPNRFISLYKDALEIWLKQRAESTLHLKSVLYSMLHTVVNDPHTADPSDSRYTSTARILTYIAENIVNTDLTVKHLCDKFYTSVSQLRRNIKMRPDLVPTNISGFYESIKQRASFPIRASPRNRFPLSVDSHHLINFQLY